MKHKHEFGGDHHCKHCGKAAEDVVDRFEEDEKNMTDDERGMANTAIMLDEAVTKRVANCMLQLFAGNVEPVIRMIPIEGVAFDYRYAQGSLRVALMDMIRTELQTLIRQEIIDAFEPDSGKLVTDGQTVTMNLRGD